MLKNVYILFLILQIIGLLTAINVHNPNDQSINLLKTKVATHAPQDLGKQNEKNTKLYGPILVKSTPGEDVTHSPTKKFRVPSTIKTPKMPSDLFKPVTGDNPSTSSNDAASYDEIKTLLAKVLEQIEEIERKNLDVDDDNKVTARKNDEASKVDNLIPSVHEPLKPSKLLTNPSITMSSGLVANPKVNKKLKKEDCKPSLDKQHPQQQKQKKPQNTIKWGHWTDWSSCSVSCGKGRQIRWRHCVENCAEAETEMEEKTCQLPACSPGKLFGVIKI